MKAMKCFPYFGFLTFAVMIAMQPAPKIAVSDSSEETQSGAALGEAEHDSKVRFKTKMWRLMI